MLAITITANLNYERAAKFFGLALLPLFIIASTAMAEGPKEQLQGTIDGIIIVLKTIRSPADIDKNKSSIRQLLVTRFDFAAMASSRWAIAGMI